MISMRTRNARSRRGAMMVLIVLVLPVLFLLAAFAVNTAYTELIRTEAQIATDISTRAAGRVYSRTGDVNEAFKVALDLAKRNHVGGNSFPLTMSDLEFGVSERPSLASRYSFDSGAVPNAVRITSNAFAAQGVERLFGSVGPSIHIGPIRSAISTQVELDIALVIDRSGSMAYAADEVAAYPPAPAAAPLGWDFGDPCPPEARWLDTIAAVQVFLQALEDSPQAERVALATYNHETTVDVHATEQYQHVLDALHQYSLAFEIGSTNIGDGIHAGLSALGNQAATRLWANKVVIVMTDGIHNTGTDPVSAASSAANQGVMVFSVTFSDEADQGRMQAVAGTGGGRHYHASTAEQLRDAFEDIARQLPTLLIR